MSDGEVGVAYCAVNPEDGVEIFYTVCAYHSGQTDLDWVASPFIANGSSECCPCGKCGEGVLGPGVTTTLSPSPPNSNNFSVPACQVRSKTVGGSFVCLVHRETVFGSSKEQALALFHFQLPHKSTLPPQPLFPLAVTITFIVVVVVQCPMAIGFLVCVICKCKSKHAGSRGSYTDESNVQRRRKGYKSG